MKRIPFDIKRKFEIESGTAKVVTEDNTEIIIIKWDAPSTYYPIIGMCPNGRALNLAEDGRRLDNPEQYVYIQLDEPDFTEFEEAVFDLIERDEETVKKEAEKLLIIARKEFMMPTKPTDVYALLVNLNLRILDIADNMRGKDKQFWEQAYRLTNSAINSIRDKEVMNC